MKLKLTFLIALSILSNILFAQTFTQRVQINCNDSIFIHPLGDPTWNAPEIIERPIWGHAILIGDFVAANILKYTSPPYFVGEDIVVVKCARATQFTCDTGIYIFEISCPNPIPFYSSFELQCGDSIYVNDLSASTQPIITEGPFNGTARIIIEPGDVAGVHYTPTPFFEGMDYVTVRLLSGEMRLYIFNMYCNFITQVSDESNGNLDIWPNPATTELLVKLPYPVEKIQCYSLEGQKVNFPYSSNGKNWEGNVSLLHPGTYTLQIITPTKTFAKKFIKI